jgi:hypothetical protein
MKALGGLNNALSGAWGGSQSSSQAEGKGFEPSTPFGASDFESDRWPIRIPSESFGMIDGPTQSLKIGLLQRQIGSDR